MASMPPLTVNIAEGTVIRPGDRVLVNLGRSISREDADAFRERWDNLMPGVGLTIVSAESIAVQHAS